MEAVRRAFQSAFGPSSGRIFQSDVGTVTVSHDLGPDCPLVLAIVRDGGAVSLLLDNYECDEAGDPSILATQLAVIATASSHTRLPDESPGPMSGFTLTDGLSILTFHHLNEDAIEPSFVDAWLARLGSEH